MLMRFNVKNFLSFDEIQEFSMIPGDVRSKSNHLIKEKNINLLRFAALYGPNASGKSNFIKALHFSRNLIRNGAENAPKNYYYKLNETRSSEPTSFEYEINIGDKYYAFGFNIILSENRFTGEWLYELKPSGDQLIYERDIVNKNFNKNLSFVKNESKLRFKIYSEDSLDNDKFLFLSELNRNKEEFFKNFKEFRIFKNIFNWFTDTLDINFPSNPVSSTDFFVDNDKSNNNRLFKLLDSLGTGITDFKLVNTPIEEMKKQFPIKILEDIQNKLFENSESIAHIRSDNNLHQLQLDDKGDLEVKTMYFTHGNNGADFALSEESDGTRRLLDLLEILLGKSEKTYVIDEIDRSLHPNLTHKFIQLFLEILHEKKIQLIITTHEDRLLDLNLLRRDEIWFVQKNEEGNSQLYSLEKFKTRFDKKIINAYLDGRYGAVPKFKNLSFLEEEEEERGGQD
ncbi:AAA family ATPase [Bacillus sp. SCS-153A]|uniref:AAA family ATPase n=1 Tax=Rossellomorea sedimentorum TaxID=3115294 RepID=UPI003906046F